MRLFRLALKRETAMPVLALGFASAISVVLVIARILWTGRSLYAFLIWNLFLAWLPLVFALLACDKYETDCRGNWRFLGLSAVWLLFFPNAPYIFTDLFHLTRQFFFQHFWVDMVLILLFAFTGLVLGFLSLYLMQSVVTRMFGRLVSWVFIGAVAILGSFGIYLGRFLRFNTWDVLVKPAALYHGIGDWMADPFARPVSFAFPMLFATFLFVSYLMLYALTHLQPAPIPVRAAEAVAVQES